MGEHYPPWYLYDISMISHRGPMAPGVGLGLQRPRPAGRGRGRRRRRAAGEALVDPGASGGCFSRQNVGISWENIGNIW